MLFEQIIGNDKIKQDLTDVIKQDRVSHSYLFIGIDGIGKMKMAKDFVQTILCENKNSCHKCKSCIQFETENHSDFNIIEPDGNSIKIEQIRILQKQVLQKPITSKNKVYIINDAGKMTKEAQNALLKTLEEPPQDTVFILIGKNENEFLITIRSRCMVLHFEPIEDDKLEQFLIKEYNFPKLTEKQKRLFGGSVGNAIKTKDKLEQFTNIEELIDNLDKMDKLQIYKKAEILYKMKDEIFDILDYINALLLEKSKSNPKYSKCIQKIENTKAKLKANSNYDMCIDDMVFSIWEEVN